MNILMISRYYYPHVGGVEKHLKNINTHLKKRGYKVKVITEKHNKNVKIHENINDVEVFRIPVLKIKYIGLLNIWINLLKYISLFKNSDIIHIHDVFIWYLPFRFIFPRKKVFVTFHGYESYPVKNSAIIVRKISELLSNGNICIGKFIENWYKTKATIVSYGAVDLDKFKKDNKKHYKYDAIFIGRLDEQTGILTYIEAVKEINKILSNFRLLTLGDGKYKKKAKEYSKCIGFTDKPEDYLKQANFAFVSRYLAILEAFAAKKMVFAVYDNPIKKDYLFNTPYKNWIVIEEDPKKLAKKVIYYLQNPYKANILINRAYNWVKNNTWENLTDTYINLWKV